MQVIALMFTGRPSQVLPDINPGGGKSIHEGSTTIWIGISFPES